MIVYIFLQNPSLTLTKCVNPTVKNFHIFVATKLNVLLKDQIFRKNYMSVLDILVDKICCLATFNVFVLNQCICDLLFTLIVNISSLFV